MLLTAKKRLIIHLIGQGFSNDKIAKELLISKPTVVKHLNTLFEETGTKGRAHLVSYAWENNILPIPDFTNRSIKVDGPKQFK